jgi:cytochrome b561
MMYVIYGVVVTVIIIGWILNKLDKNKPSIVFEYKDMPHMKPLPMGTSGVGFWKGIKMWLTSTRKW